ncbi:MAG: 5-oxoprolinase subunit PxpA [Dermatophilaceae bacterium]
MTERSIDLNADVGESFGRWRLGDDAGLLRVVTSANIACGFHAGDPATIVRTCRLAVEAGVAIGAHVSYRDLAGFGRRFLDVAAEDLDAEVRYQIGALDGIARSVGGRVAYVKPHGALYTAVVTHEGQAAALVRAIGSVGPEVAVLGLSGSALLGLAEAAGLPTVAEAFADRGYTPEGTLVPRDRPGALVTDPDAVVARVVRLVTDGVVASVDGGDVAVSAGSICVHGDTPGAVSLATAVRAGLTAAGVRIAAPAAYRP